MWNVGWTLESLGKSKVKQQHPPEMIWKGPKLLLRVCEKCEILKKIAWKVEVSHRPNLLLNKTCQFCFYLLEIPSCSEPYADETLNSLKVASLAWIHLSTRSSWESKDM